MGNFDSGPIVTFKTFDMDDKIDLHIYITISSYTFKLMFVSKFLPGLLELALAD